MANVNNQGINPKAVTIPQNFSIGPVPGKLESLYNSNSDYLYNKLNPYTGAPTGIFGLGIRQPFIYVTPNTAKKGINKLKKNDSRAFPIGSGLQDIERVSKFLGTVDGVLFIAKNQLLQSFSAFPETKVYNPAESLVASSRAASLFILPRPQRHIDLGGGILGALASVIGFSVPNGPSSPITTTGYQNDAQVLPSSGQDSGKGLIRGGTANTAIGVMQNRMGVGNPKTLMSLAKSMFASIVPVKSPGKYKADESGYDMLLNSPLLAGNDVSKRATRGGIVGFIDSFILQPSSIKENKQLKQRWYNGFGSNNPNIDRRLRVNKFYINTQDILDGEQIGYSISNNPNYGDAIRSSITDDHQNSDIVLIYKNFSGPERTIIGSIDSKNHRFTTPRDDNGFPLSSMEVNAIDKISGSYANEIFSVGAENTNLSREQSKLELAETTIAVNKSNIRIDGKNSSVLAKGDVKISISDQLNALLNGIESVGLNAESKNSLVNTTYKDLAANKNNGVLSDNTIDRRYFLNSKEQTLEFGKRFGGTNQPDYINTLTVVDASDFKSNGQKLYKPYADDLIAFYFHDLVNDKYIPFRANIKGLSEQNAAEWSEVKYVGRSNKTFNYIGFSRNITFSFDVVITSITEILPTWTKINYLCGLTKPSGYSEGQFLSQFPIPPLVSFTLGDLYKEQPFVINSITLTVPDDALWEVLNEDSSQDWNYLNKRITWGNSQGKFGQMPRECNISIGGNLIEKEQPSVGKNNFGDSFATKNSFSNNMVVTL